MRIADTHGLCLITANVNISSSAIARNFETMKRKFNVEGIHIGLGETMRRNASLYCV